MKDWLEIIAERTAQMKNLRGGTPDVMKAFSDIAQAALAGKALDGKTKELIALGISVAIRCDDCIAFHAKAALRQGHPRRSNRDAWDGGIYGSGSVRDVRDPRTRCIRTIWNNSCSRGSKS